jgi:hypothetical protein
MEFSAVVSAEQSGHVIQLGQPELVVDTHGEVATATPAPAAHSGPKIAHLGKDYNANVIDRTLVSLL